MESPTWLHNKMQHSISKRFFTLVASLLISAFVSQQAIADAYKCRTVSGKVEISNEGCNGGSRLEQITTAAPVTIDRQRQAAEVSNRMLNQLDGIAKGNAIYQQQLRQQQVAQEAIDQQQAAQQSRADAQDRHKRCLDEAMRYREPEQGRMVAVCNGRPYQNENITANVGPVAQPGPLPVIKSCNGNQCSDQMGNRYNTTVGKTVRSDGKRCYQRGNAMYCD